MISAEMRQIYRRDINSEPGWTGDFGSRTDAGREFFSECHTYEGERQEGIDAAKAIIARLGGLGAALGVADPPTT